MPAAPAGPPLVLLGKVVTMEGKVIDQGAVYCRDGEILEVAREQDPAPDGFGGVAKISTGGVIYPGLIDLHNHLSYNVIPLWCPARPFEDRADWRGPPAHPDYLKYVKRPMEKIAVALAPEVVRYVEAKLVVGGTTSAQGMSIKQDGLYRGMVRNFEQESGAKYPSAGGEINDWPLRNPVAEARMRGEILAGRRFFHHLAEGRGQRARDAYFAVRDTGLQRPNYVGIHGTGLKEGDYAEFKKTGASLVWSPTSNYLLYGQTLDIKRLMDSGIPWGFGSDWSPSGTKNILGEMKVGWLAAKAAKIDLDFRLVAEAATAGAAEIVGWGQSLGRIAPGCGADLLVLKDKIPEDPYKNLVLATEREIRLVLIEGVPRYGDQDLMLQSGTAPAKMEACTVAGRPRYIYCEHPNSDPRMKRVSLRQAIERLEAGMRNLKELEPPIPHDGFRPLELELDIDEAADLAPPVDFRAMSDVRREEPMAESLPLDGLTAVDDAEFFTRLKQADTDTRLFAELHKLYLE